MEKQLRWSAWWFTAVSFCLIAGLACELGARRQNSDSGEGLTGDDNPAIENTAAQTPAKYLKPPKSKKKDADQEDQDQAREKLLYTDTCVTVDSWCIKIPKGFVPFWTCAGAKKRCRSAEAEDDFDLIVEGISKTEAKLEKETGERGQDLTECEKRLKILRAKVAGATPGRRDGWQQKLNEETQTCQAIKIDSREVLDQRRATLKLYNGMRRDLLESYPYLAKEKGREDPQKGKSVKHARGKNEEN